MADTTKEILTLEDKTTVRMRGQVVNVFPMESGKVKSGKRMGEDWWRQDLVLRDAEGEAKVQWWSPGPTETMTILQGMQVEINGKVNAWLDRNNEVHKDVRCSGNDAVRPLDGATLYQPPGATNSPAPAQGTSQGQKMAQGGSGAVQRQGSSALPLAEYQRWWLARWEWYENSPAIRRAIARGEAVARTIRDAIGAEWMSQPPTERDIERSPYGGAPAARQDGPDEEERAAYRSGPQPGDDDDDIPF